MNPELRKSKPAGASALRSYRCGCCNRLVLHYTLSLRGAVPASRCLLSFVTFLFGVDLLNGASGEGFFFIFVLRYFVHAQIF